MFVGSCTHVKFHLHTCGVAVACLRNGCWIVLGWHASELVWYHVHVHMLITPHRSMHRLMQCCINVVVDECINACIRCMWACVVVFMQSLTGVSWQLMRNPFGECIWQQCVHVWRVRIQSDTPLTNNRCRQRPSYRLQPSIFTTVSWFAAQVPRGLALRLFYLFIFI